MRIVLPLMLLGTLATAGAEGIFGTWRVNLTRSTGPDSDLVKVRLEPHGKGEVFTVERVHADGRATTSSTILFRYSAARFSGFGLFRHPIVPAFG
jgi:hypothetical protein